MAEKVIIVSIAIIIVLILLGKSLVYKFRANQLKVHISWKQLIGQSLRRTLTIDILKAAALAQEHNFGVTVATLEMHKLAGGNPLTVISHMIDAHERGEPLDYTRASTIDLAGEDIRQICVKEY
jgi:uncharacterized protein YqfA (UPF0365 family)